MNNDLGDNNEIFDQFDKIEGKVEKLIDTCKSLQASNTELKNKVERLEQELQGKGNAEKLFTEQKDLVRSKIDSLLTKLDDFSETGL